ncbi:MAG: hypothetical protein QG650_1169, partial [Patescibacteria group bacterium]|nr:hypothetical protein [Patescibacteria group bacterium]
LAKSAGWDSFLIACREMADVRDEWIAEPMLLGKL